MPAPAPASFSCAAPLGGSVTVPGDKSISHRALMLAAIAAGESRIERLLEGEDVLATAAAMRAMGAEIARGADGVWTVRGTAGVLVAPANALDMGNSGTSARLLMGLVASHPITVAFAGDASLSRRPMRRVTDPLVQMGATFDTADGDRLPLTVRGCSPARAIDYRLPVASAQVKSAVLLAALNTPGITRVIEPLPTRDHSETMLRGFGARVDVETDADGTRTIALHGPATLAAQDIVVPGDISSAAFPIVAALLVPGSAVTITNVGVNPTRTGLLRALDRMRADVTLTNARDVGGEPVADIVVRHGPLAGFANDPADVAAGVDEYPILFVAAAFAHGRSTFTGLGELRVKESDRLALMAAGLRAIGAQVEETPDGMIVDGTGGVPLAGGATIATMLDHRIAMSFAVAGLVSRAPVTIDDLGPVATSFPGFVALMTALGATCR